MTLNVKLVEVATVPIGLPHRTELKLSVRGLSCSKLIAADVNYGFKQTETNPDFPTWEGAYSIGVHFNDERSEVFLDGRYYSHPNRKGQTHFLYVSDLAHIDFMTPRHTQEVILQRSFMREIAEDLEVPHVTHLGNSLYHMTDDPVLRRLALRIYPFFDAPETSLPSSVAFAPASSRTVSRDARGLPRMSGSSDGVSSAPRKACSGAISSRRLLSHVDLLMRAI